MKRHGNLWQEFISPDNFELACKNSQIGKKNRRNVLKFNANRAENLENIRQSVINGTFHTSAYTTKTVYEPKKRIIYVLPYAPDRIVQHALMNILIPIYDKILIDDCYACRVGRGIHSGSIRTSQFVRRNKYVLKCDVSKFYPSIRHDILLKILSRKIKDCRLMNIIRDIVHSVPDNRNVPIGNYCSQWFGNIYMNELDRFVKDKLRCRDYLRYCDDFCLFSDDKAYLHGCARQIRDFLHNKLDLHFSKCDVFPVTRGVDFLGYRHFKKYILVRKRTSKRIKRRILAMPRLVAKNKIPLERALSVVGSSLGVLRHANTYNFRRRIGLDLIHKSLKIQQREKHYVTKL